MAADSPSGMAAMTEPSSAPIATDQPGRFDLTADAVSHRMRPVRPDAWRAPWRWLRRYGPAELAGTGAAVVGAAVAAPLGDPILLGAAAAWSENVGYYGALIARDLARLRRARPRRDAAGVGRAVAAAVAALAVEFGPAEALDSLLVRPALMAAGLRLAPDPQLGVLLGKLAADATFYVPTILTWEWRRRSPARPGAPAGRPSIEEAP
jgi:hypothetical protein